MILRMPGATETVSPDRDFFIPAIFYSKRRLGSRFWILGNGRGESRKSRGRISYGLRVAGYELRVTSYGLRVAGCELRVTGYGLRVAGKKRFQIADCRFQVAECRNGSAPAVKWSSGLVARSVRREASYELRPRGAGNPTRCARVTSYQ